MIKHFCDECEIEVDNPSFSLDMTGKCLCSKHLNEYLKLNNHSWSTKAWDKDRFPKYSDEIICQHCNKGSGLFNKNLTHLVLFHDLLCQNCGEIVVYSNNGITL